MAGDSDATTSRPRKRTCVALAEHTVEASEIDKAVVVGNCVTEEAVKRSGLLSGIEDAEGLASLPGHLTPDDIRLWETACFIGGSFPTDELVTVLKVADALCDNDEAVNKWRTMLAERALATDWRQPPRADAMLCSLLRLPPHLLQSVMSECRSQQHGRSCCTLHTFPHSLHPAIILADTTQSGHLAIESQNSTAELAFLPCITFPPPGLQSLSIVPFHSTIPHPNVPPQVAPPLALPALLGHAVSAHPSLTKLSLAELRPALPPQWLRTFAACLAPGALPRLVDLNFTFHASPSGCVDASACLRRLPALTALHISLSVPVDPAAAEVPLSTYAPLAAAPTSLPNLHRLCLEDYYADRDMQLPFVEPGSSAPAFLALIAAPALKELELKLRAHLPSVQPLFSHILRFTALETACVDARLKWHLSQGMFRTAGLDVDALEGKLPTLVSVKVDSECPVSPLYIANAFVKLAAGSLTTLELAHSRQMIEYDENGLDGAASMAMATWHRLSPALGRCTGLRSLSMPALGCACGAPFSEYFASALTPLSHLQTLRLTPVENSPIAMPLRGSQIARGLSSLTALESLSFDHFPDFDQYGGEDRSVMFTFDSVAPVMRVLPELQRLTHVRLHVDGLTPPLLAEMLPKMPALRRVRVLSRMFRDLAGGEDPDWYPEVEKLHQRFPHVRVSVME